MELSTITRSITRRILRQAFTWVTLIGLVACTQPTPAPTPLASPLQTPTPRVTATARVTATPLAAARSVTPTIPLTATTPTTPTDSSEVRYSGGTGRLAFATDLGGIYQIGVLDMASGKVAMLTQSPDPGDAEPQWSSDGDTIYFTSGRDSALGFGIYKMSDDGSDQTALIQVAGQNTINTGAAVSPDGKQILFHSNRDGNLEIYVANIDGTDPRNLTNNLANDVTAIWKADGAKILFSSDRDKNEYQLYEMNADGSDVQSFISAPGSSNFAPRFSPDGSRIAFLTRPSLGGYAQIAVADVSNGKFDIVTNGFDSHARVDWIDDDTLVYTSRVSENMPWGIYMLNFVTRVRTTLVLGGANFTDPDWTDR